MPSPPLWGRCRQAEGAICDCPALVGRGLQAICNIASPHEGEARPSGGIGRLFVDDAFLDMIDHAFADDRLAMGGAHVLDRAADDFGVVIGPRMPVASGDE